ncbi:MAG: hypothetical protein R2681_08305 [Pyrinomonadaceae bacterium]
MLISSATILFITVCGLLLTYLFSKDKPLLWRLAAGNIAGSAVFGLICFLAANFFGLSASVVFISLLISAWPFILLWNKDIKIALRNDWQRAKDRTQGGSLKMFWRLSYYLFFVVLFFAFFDRAMIIGYDGIFTGASQNLGDLPFHLGAIFSFSEGNNFPPQNPSFADAKFTYPFIADFLTACLLKLGADIKSVMLMQNAAWALSLLVILQSFVEKITGSKPAGRIAAVMLFFSGGLGFLWFIKDFWNSGFGITDFLWNLPRDYTISDEFRWGNPLVTLFITQRSLLLGMPLTIIVLERIWAIFDSGKETTTPANNENGKLKKKNKIENDSGIRELLPFFIVGLLAGCLPLIHAHSLAVLFIASAFWFFVSITRWKYWITFAAGVLVIALPELFWILSGSASHTSEFIGWHFGWDSRGENLVWFWIKNTGIFIPLLAAAVFMMFFAQKREGTKKEKEKSKREVLPDGFPVVPGFIYFVLPFVFIFLLANIAKFAPWEWDNIKILIYSFVGALPFSALLLAWMWEKGTAFKIGSAGLLLILTFSGALDVWRTASAQMRHQVFDQDAVEIADAIRLRTPENALVLNAPTYNSAVVLSGRRSLMRYTGHLSSHGIDFKERENDLKRIYSGAGTADIFLKKYGIGYVLISPRETESLQVNEEYFSKFPVLYEVGDYKVYEVK